VDETCSVGRQCHTMLLSNWSVNVESRIECMSEEDLDDSGARADSPIKVPSSSSGTVVCGEFGEISRRCGAWSNT
jgi:hypothetical protein